MRRLLVPVVLAALALTGCSDSSDEPAANPTDPTEAAMSAMSSRMSEATAPIDTDVAHPCDTASAAAVGRLVGSSVTTSRVPETGKASLMTCTYTPSDLGKPIVTLQATVDGGTVDEFVRLMVITGGHATAFDLPGADDASMIVDDDEKFPTATAVASVDGTILAAITGGSGGPAPTDLAREALALLVSG